MSRSPFQRFSGELRRRRVPQTVAVYLVAAWAAIEFSDVVVPNLNGPQWIVTAVIIAALVGLPVVLVLAWVFEWSPEGLRRTQAEGDSGDSSGREGPWLAAAVTILVVAIGAAVGVAYLLQGQDREAAAPTEAGTQARRPGVSGAGEGAPSTEPGGVPVAESLRADVPGSESLPDSLQTAIRAALAVLDSMDLSELGSMANLGAGAAASAAGDVGVLVARPQEWRMGMDVPTSLVQGGTLVVEGAAYDDAGVRAVLVDGDTVVTDPEGRSMLPFSATLHGTGRVGTRHVEIMAVTLEGREVRRIFQIVQLPSDIP